MKIKLRVVTSLCVLIIILDIFKNAYGIENHVYDKFNIIVRICLFLFVNIKIRKS